MCFGFTDAYNPGSVGVISTNGKITVHTSTYIDDPAGITTGPDGDLWVTNAGTKTTKGSIARLTPNGKITVYTNSGLEEPLGITTGPDKAIWFTNYGGKSIGRITTGGQGRLFTGTGIDEPDSITSGTGRRPVVHQLRQQLDRADHHQRKGHQLHRYRHRWPSGDHSRTGRGPVVHQISQQLDSADHHRREGHQLRLRRTSSIVTLRANMPRRRPRDRTGPI